MEPVILPAAIVESCLLPPDVACEAPTVSGCLGRCEAAATIAGPAVLLFFMSCNEKPSDVFTEISHFQDGY